MHQAFRDDAGEQNYYLFSNKFTKEIESWILEKIKIGSLFHAVLSTEKKRQTAIDHEMILGKARLSVSNFDEV